MKNPMQISSAQQIPQDLSKRRFVMGASSLLALSALPFSKNILAQGQHLYNGPKTIAGREFDLTIDHQAVNFTGAPAMATTVNQSLPGPVLRWKQGEKVRLNVANLLHHPSSIHWHGIILPTEMDGVPGLSFNGIKPGEKFTYEFDVQQSGTYWYHSHSGFQEQTGLLGAIIIDPQEPEPFAYDRDLVVMLSDWSDTAPDKIYARLKKMSHYYNYRERTLGNLISEVKTQGLKATWNQRAMWNQMRMSDSDISDVNGHTYTYLMNGVTPDKGWLGLHKPGEKIRLRFINAGAMTIFDVRIPGLKMTVVAADGQYVQPIEVDEFRMGTAETYDVIVEPQAQTAYTIFAQSIDRTGYARGTLTSAPTLTAEVPAMDPVPVLSHADMGMDMGDMNNMEMDHNKMDHKKMDHSKMNMSDTDISSMDMSSMDMSEMDMDAMDMGGMDMHDHNMKMDHSTHQMPAKFAKAGFGSNFDPLPDITHAKTEFGPHVDSHAQMPASGLSDPGVGLRHHMHRFGRKVLTYADLKNLTPTRDKREPSREIELHLTGNMDRYMWSFNGINFASADPLQLTYGERVRIILVNDTMMTHPIHLHGMWSELETGDPDFIPRKHTILVQPGKRISYLVTADAKGRWAYHCHLLYHMMGMMREVRVA